MHKSLLVLVLALILILSSTIANESENPSKEDIILVMEKIDKILQEKDYEKFRSFYPQLFETVFKFWKSNQELNKELSSKEDRWHVNEEYSPYNPEPLETDDVSNAVLRFITAWLNKEEIKRKRGYHRALCHFKICNMGSNKRNNYWDARQIN